MLTTIVTHFNYLLYSFQKMTLDEQLQFALALEHPSMLTQQTMTNTSTVRKTRGMTKHVGGQST